MEEVKEFDKDSDRKIFELKKENQELKETIINMSKIMFKRDNELSEVIKSIDSNLRKISRRK